MHVSNRILPLAYSTETKLPAEIKNDQPAAAAADQYETASSAEAPQSADAERIIAALHQKAEALLEQGPIDENGANTLVALALASGITSPVLKALDNLADLGDDAARKIFKGATKDTPGHIRARSKSCSIIELRAAQDLRDLALRDGKLDPAEVKALAELGLTHEFSAAGRKVLDDVLSRAAIGSLSSNVKRSMIEGAIAAWSAAAVDRPLGAEEVKRIGWLLDVAGFRASDRAMMWSIRGLDKIAPEAKPSLDALLGRPAIGDPAEWTVLVYMSGNSNAELMTSININEMERGGQKPGIVNVIAMIDAGGRNGEKMPAGWSGGTRFLWISKDASNRISSREVHFDRSEPLGEMFDRYRDNVDMANPQVLRAAAQAARKIAPSNHFMINILGHGNAWYGGAGFEARPKGEEFHGSVMGYWDGQLETALKGVGVDVLACNSCSMSSQEIARSAERAGIGYLAASEDTVPMTGFRYETLFNGIADLWARDGSLAPEAMAKWVTDMYADAPPTGSLGHSSFSVTDLKKMPALREQLDKFAEALIAAGGVDKNKLIRAAYLDTPTFFNPDIDIVVFARNIATRCKNTALVKEARAMIKAIKNICYSRTNSPPKVDKKDVPLPREKQLNKQGVPLRNQWDLPAREQPAGLTIYAPRNWVDSRYSNSDAPWAGSAWITFLKGIEKKPLTDKEMKAAKTAREAKKTAHVERVEARKEARAKASAST
jgi:hypothetical protein